MAGKEEVEPVKEGSRKRKLCKGQEISELAKLKNKQELRIYQILTLIHISVY